MTRTVGEADHVESLHHRTGDKSIARGETSYKMTGMWGIYYVICSTLHCTVMMLGYCTMSSILKPGVGREGLKGGSKKLYTRGSLVGACEAFSTKIWTLISRLAMRLVISTSTFLPLFFRVTTFFNRTAPQIKKLILQKLIGAPKNLGVDTFPDPVGHFGAPWRTLWIFEVLIKGMI